MLSGIEDGTTIEIPDGWRPVITTQPNRYYDIARTEGLFYKQASGYYFEVVSKSPLFSAHGPKTVSSIRRPSKEEYPSNVETLCVLFPELAKLMVDAADRHFLLLHKLQYQRLKTLFAPGIPDAAFVLLRESKGRARPAIVQQAIEGRTLLEMNTQSPGQKEERLVAEQLRQYTGSEHVDWAFGNFVWAASSNTLFYVDSKPTLFRTKRRNDENKRFLMERFRSSERRRWWKLWGR